MLRALYLNIRKDVSSFSINFGAWKSYHHIKPSDWLRMEGSPLRHVGQESKMVSKYYSDSRWSLVENMIVTVIAFSLNKLQLSLK